MLDTRKLVDVAVRLAVALALVAVIVGAVAVFTSGYTAGNFVHDVVLLVLALAVLSVSAHGVRIDGRPASSDEP